MTSVTACLERLLSICGMPGVTGKNSESLLSFTEGDHSMKVGTIFTIITYVKKRLSHCSCIKGEPMKL